MIKNLSLEFIQLRNIQTMTCEVYLNCDYLRKHLSQLDKNIAVYKNLINYDNLPSFKENVKNKEKIKDIKAHIETSFNNIHTEIKQFTIQIENKIISDTIYNYFEKCLENAILIYRKIITENIKKTSSFEILNSIVNDSNVTHFNIFDNQYEYLQKNSNRQINKSLLSISNTLMEIKINLKEQSLFIDSLDRYFESTNKYLIMANEEIRKIPKTYIGVKDKIITLLITILIVLLLMLLIKEYNKNKNSKISLHDWMINNTTKKTISSNTDNNM
ncbi:t-SNARE complex subunit, syntaxin [Enterocytozoon bieneusi H348]|nr:t-SNARE complex subunit, syntaxin [Enterocytozoon bieneusi H348]|eukprot:XP_001827851.1 t-SNARE complex subunit, syntaxin [Enterocytozoon bieneusi H348]